MPTKHTQAALKRARCLFSVLRSSPSDVIRLRLPNGADMIDTEGSPKLRRCLVDGLAAEFDAHAAEFQGASAALTKDIATALAAWSAVSAKGRNDLIEYLTEEARMWDESETQDSHQWALADRAAAALLLAVAPKPKTQKRKAR